MRDLLGLRCEVAQRSDVGAGAHGGGPRACVLVCCPAGSGSEIDRMVQTAHDAVTATAAWLDHAVIGLGLCPFAGAVRAGRQVRFAVSAAADWPALRSELCDELALLAAADPARVETTLLICPSVPAGFDEYNQFLDEADDAVRGMALEGVIQVASFHPQYRFAGSDGDDVADATNRSPYPMLHLLRERSIERAVAAFGDTGAIVEANIRTLRALGSAGWDRLRAGWLRADDALAPPPGEAPCR